MSIAKESILLPMTREEMWKFAGNMAAAGRRKLAEDRKELEAIRNAARPDVSMQDSSTQLPVYKS